MGGPERSGGGLVRRRIVAFLVDAVVVASAAWVAAGRVVRSRGWRLLTAGGASVLGGLGYHVVLEGRFGRTVGKAVTGVVVARADGRPCTYTAAAVRTGFRLVDWLPAGYLLGFAVMALTDRERRLGDLAAGTVVVEDGPRRDRR